MFVQKSIALPIGLLVKAGIVNLTNYDRAANYGAMLWMTAKVQSPEGEQAQRLWTEKGSQAFDAEGRDERMGRRTYPQLARAAAGTKPEQQTSPVRQRRRRSQTPAQEAFVATARTFVEPA
ncbi:conjugal transfer protein TraD [Mesorhizobium sp. M0317]|uniref:conjugal transfer protein TraD n=1 Tax=Mesorhizobium sp. M0317 TaxID=2956935 RepID=UPI00333B8E49